MPINRKGLQHKGYRHRQFLGPTVMDHPALLLTAVGAAALVMLLPAVIGDVSMGAVIGSVPFLASYLGGFVLMLVVLAAVAQLRRNSRNRRLAVRRTLQRLTPSQFEALISEVLRRQGYNVLELHGQGDNQLDLLLHSDGEMVLGRCERRHGLVGVDVVRALARARCEKLAISAILLTTASYDDAAIAVARGHHIRLIDGPQLERLVAQLERFCHPRLADADLL